MLVQRLLQFTSSSGEDTFSSPAPETMTQVHLETIVYSFPVVSGFQILQRTFPTGMHIEV